MARGPKPAPASVREQKAAVRSKRQAPPSVEAVAAQPAGIKPPTGLKAEALVIWNRLAPTLVAAKLLSAADVGAFGRYCRNFATWERLRNKLDKAGYSYESESAHGKLRRVDPDFMIADRLERQLLAAEDRFGLNPSERQRIMAARSQSGVVGDLFTDTPKPTDPAAAAASAARPAASPIGMLN